MALLHRAELHPTKLELLAGWLPQHRWHRGPAAPQLTRVAGFRFDDPAGDVGIETMLVHAGGEMVFHVPLTYRGAPLPDRDAWLIGTSEHSVLGRRWIYDACGDPVYAVALANAIIAGTGQAEELVEIDGRIERREPSMGIASTIGATGAAPVIDALLGVWDGEEVTTIITAPMVLSVLRSVEPISGSPPAILPALIGTWSGQPDPVELAFAYRR